MLCLRSPRKEPKRVKPSNSDFVPTNSQFAIHLKIRIPNITRNRFLAEKQRKFITDIADETAVDTEWIKLLKVSGSDHKGLSIVVDVVVRGFLSPADAHGRITEIMERGSPLRNGHWGACIWESRPQVAPQDSPNKKVGTKNRKVTLDVEAA